MAGISAIAKVAGVKDSEAKAIFDAIKSSPERITIQGFGTFETKTRAARTARNPKSGEEISVPAKEVLTFKASRQK